MLDKPENFAQRPAVSVIMASYNYARYLGDAMESVLNQSFAQWELLVVDDGSSDNSLDIIKSYVSRDARVKLLQHEGGVNRGLPATIGLGLEHACGEYVAFLESDDMWAPDCLEERLQVLKNTGAGAVFNHIELLDMGGAGLEGYSGQVNAAYRRFSGAKGAFSLGHTLMVQNDIPTFSCIMLETSILKECGFESAVPRWLDWWLWVQVSLRGKFAYSEKKLTIWRIHGQSYNSKTGLRAYLGDAARMWRGIKQLYRAYQGQGKRPFLLRMPLAVPLVLRAFNLIRYSGFSALAGKCKGRFFSGRG